jgi:hypothetical protein
MVSWAEIQLGIQTHMQLPPETRSELSTSIWHYLLWYTTQTHNPGHVQLCKLSSCIHGFHRNEVSYLGQTIHNDPNRIITISGTMTEPLKLLPHYRLNPSSGSLSNNTEVTRRLCRVVPGKSLTSQDRHLYNKLMRRRVQRQTNHKLLHKTLQRFIITNQVFCITVNSSDFKTQRN